MESSAKIRLPLHSIDIISPSPSLRTSFSLWYNLHLYSFVPLGESKRAHISFTKYSFLAIHAKGGESISPKQKDCTTTNFKVFLKKTYN
jgi:hypothetical protein